MVYIILTVLNILGQLMIFNSGLTKTYDKYNYIWNENDDQLIEYGGFVEFPSITICPDEPVIPNGQDLLMCDKWASLKISVERRLATKAVPRDIRRRLH